MKKKGLTLNQKVAFIRKAEKFHLTLSTVKNLVEQVLPELESLQEFEICTEMKLIEKAVSNRKRLLEATLIKNAGLSNNELKKMLHL